jgi:hypothetical protein
MKIRTGFVSNSSSSSFIIHGFEFNIKEMADKLEIPENSRECDSGTCYAIKNKLSLKGWGKGTISIEETRDFFDGNDTGVGIIGMILGVMDDGCVFKIPKVDEAKLRKKLYNLLGREVTEKFHTYVQYISNDNY